MMRLTSSLAGLWRKMTLYQLVPRNPPAYIERFPPCFPRSIQDTVTSQLKKVLSFSQYRAAFDDTPFEDQECHDTPFRIPTLTPNQVIDAGRFHIETTTPTATTTTQPITLYQRKPMWVRRFAAKMAASPARTP